MRVFLVLTALTITSMPSLPEALPIDAPRVVIQNNDCAAAQRSARVISEALGFSQARVTCAAVSARATLSRAVAPRTPPVRNLITYSVPEPRYFSPPSVDTTFKVPSEVPWAAATGTIVAYVKLDALLVTVRADDALETAFALENAGISRDDIITAPPPGNGNLFVRVRPISVAQVLKIASVARAHLHASEANSPVDGQKAFVRDCDGIIASLSGLALAVARERASVMARAAHTALGEPLSVVDRGGRVIDAVCGLGKDASIRQLAAAAEDPARAPMHGPPELCATVIRSIDAAWRLKLPANPAGEPLVYQSPDFSGRRYAPEPRAAFVADGRQAHADRITPPDSLMPDRVSILIPDWAYDALQKSPYAADLRHISLEISPPLPAVVMRAVSTPQLERRVTSFQEYASRLAARAGKHLDLSFLYSQTDCRSATNAALFWATSDAIAGLHGKAIRYLQETSVFATGFVSCLYEPTSEDDWLNSSASKRDTAAAAAFVVVGY